MTENITYFRGIFPCVEYKSCINDLPWQWEYIEWAVYKVIPFSCDIQATQLFITPGFILNCKGTKNIKYAANA